MKHYIIAVMFILGVAIPSDAMVGSYTVDASDVAAAFAAMHSGDMPTAIRDFTSAARQGNIQAQGMLGGIYITGSGVAQNCELGLSLENLAAREGDRQAVYNIGVEYLNGTCVAQDFGKAMLILKVDGMSGWAEAETDVGVMYDHGYGVPRDDATAMRWFMVAADQNNALAQMDIGMLDVLGQGIPHDSAAAIMWVDLAQKNNVSPAFVSTITTARQTILRFSTPDQISQGQAMANAWSPPSLAELKSSIIALGPP